MNDNFLPCASPIGVKWITDEGGVGIIACTDDKALPILGLYPLNRMGEALGLPCFFPQRRLITDYILGLRCGKPALIYIDAEVTEWGLETIVIPAPGIGTHDIDRSRYAPWGSEMPKFPLFSGLFGDEHGASFLMSDVA